jgi:hypothetical protein
MAFDEAYYLESNPEVAEAVRRGEWSSGYVHYCVLGKARGMAASPPVDAAWYLASYPCVARDIAEGRAVSPTEHYDRLGRFRGYLPSPAAHRPDNPSATHSRFGGLWTDAGNVLDVIAGRLDLGLVSATQAAMLTAWVSNGYVVLPAAISTDILDRAEEDLDRAYHGDFPDLRFNVRSVGQRCPWSKETLEQPTKALDLHWFSASIRELIFAAGLLDFLHLIFERRVLASQSLSFWRGSAQNAHQDSAYVNYSLPLQFAASWIALEDVRSGAGELFYYAGSHRMPEFLYANRFKGSEEARRANRELDLTSDLSRHVQLIPDQALGAGFPKETFNARRGDVLFWNADLAHGGAPISSVQTRKSVVTHYCPADVVPIYFERTPHREVRSFEQRAFYSSPNYS